MFPPIPSWNALHPLIIHFPIALLLIAPVFVLIAAVVSPGKARPYLLVALLLMVLGTVGAFVAVATGEAAGELAERTTQAKAQIERHEGLAELTRNIFTVLTLVFAGIIALPAVLKRAQARWATTVLPIAFLLAYGVGALVLANTAHQGGRLVHEFGVRAAIATGTPAQNAAPPATINDKDE